MSDNIPGKVSVMTTAVIWAQDEHLTDMGQYLVNPSVTTFQGENIGEHHIHTGVFSRQNWNS